MPIAQFTPYPVLRRLFARYPIDPPYRRRARARLRTSLLVEPLRRTERLCHGRRIDSTPIPPRPIFLLGYGRSGTTHLHNLLWRDPRFGGVSNYQASAQPFALSARRWLPALVRPRLPARRPMDNVAVELEGPQEEEVALVNAVAEAPLHFLSFPRALPEIYDAFVCDLGRDREASARFRAGYLDVLRVAAILTGGRRQVLKTPTHTARIPFLLETFPDARFVHIVRDPYRVYRSMRNMYRKLLPRETLQEFDWAAIDAWTVAAYERVMRRYLEDRDRIPAGRLFECRYEDLDARPLDVLSNLYDALALGAFESVQPALAGYLESLGSFEKNRFDASPESEAVVSDRWGFALEAFGYPRRMSGPPGA